MTGWIIMHITAPDSKTKPIVINGTSLSVTARIPSRPLKDAHRVIAPKIIPIIIGGIPKTPSIALAAELT